MILPRPVLGVVFDMDGLLIDSESVWRDAQLAEAAARGRHLPLDVVHGMIGLQWPLSLERLGAHFGPDFDVDAYIDGASRRVEAIKREGVALKAGVVEMLDLLDELRLPRAIATSSSHKIVDLHMGHTGLLQRFDAVIAQGDYACGKPSPDPFLAAAGVIGREPSACLALEDSHNGVRAAHAAGMMTVMVPDLLEPTEEMHALCVGVAETLHHVREALARQAR